MSQTLDEVLAEPKPTQQEYRLGIIRVPWLLLKGTISIDEADTQGKLRNTGVFAQLHKKLCLPASYSIYGVFFSPWRTDWDICVESPDLPVVPQHAEPPQIIPLYTRNDDETYSLVEIKIDDRWQRTYSPEELTIERL